MVQTVKCVNPPLAIISRGLVFVSHAHKSKSCSTGKIAPFTRLCVKSKWYQRNEFLHDESAIPVKRPVEIWHFTRIAMTSLNSSFMDRILSLCNVSYTI